jgi:hypothetical protein
LYELASFDSTNYFGVGSPPLSVVAERPPCRHRAARCAIIEQDLNPLYVISIYNDRRAIEP